VRSLGRTIDVALILIGANDRRAGLPLSVTSSAMRDIVRFFRNLGAEAIMVGDGRDTRDQGNLDSLRSSLAEQEQVPFIPGALAGFLPGSGLTLPDGIHPNADGVLVMAERLTGPVRQALRIRHG
jgi:acyl-CoA thioesterase-1